MGIVPHRRRVIRVAAVVLLLALGTAVSAGVYVERTLVAPIDRIENVFAGLPDRPDAADTRAGTAAMNVLLLGTDRRSVVPTTGEQAGAPAWEFGAQRSDAMLVAHISANRSSVSFISLPRDSWVEVPGHGWAKINAAYSWGGPRLAVQTVEKLTGVRIDHLAVIDWEGVRRLTDALGGIVVDVPHTVHDPVRDVTWTAGEHRLDGQATLDYVAQRYGLPGGDLDRARRQQNVLRLVLRNTLARVGNDGLIGAYRLVRVVAANVSVDAGWSTTAMARLAWSLRDVEVGQARFLTAPVTGTDRVAGQSIVRLDRVRGRALWEAIHRDDLDSWLRQNPEIELTEEIS